MAFEWTYNGLRFRLSDHEPRFVQEFTRGSWEPSFQANALFGLREAATDFDRVNAENAVLRRALGPFLHDFVETLKILGEPNGNEGRGVTVFTRREPFENGVSLDALREACRLMDIPLPEEDREGVEPD